MMTAKTIDSPTSLTSDRSDYYDDDDDRSDDDDHSADSSNSQEQLEEDESDDEESCGWMNRLDQIALFGSSFRAVVISFVLLTVSIGCSLYLEESGTSFSIPSHVLPTTKNWYQSISDTIATYQAYKKLGPVPNVGPPIIYEIHTDNNKSNDETTEGNMESKDLDIQLVTDEMRQRYEEDGVIAIRGLIDTDLLDRIVSEAESMVESQRQKNYIKTKERPKVLTGKPPQPKQFFMTQQGVVFGSFNDYGVQANNETQQSNTTNGYTDDNDRHEDVKPVSSKDNSAFLQVAMMSKIPKVASILLGLEDDSSCTNETVRLMRDIFLAKDEEEYICGFHVDDVGFWPALANATGVNAWVALDDMPVSNGGGFAVAVGSHRASWKNDAYTITGSTHRYPDGGFQSSRDILQNRPGNGTCNIESSAPHLHRRMEETMRVYDVKRGDVIFHTRWLFHRTIAFDRSLVEQQKISGKPESIVYKRYSIRYSPGSAVIPPGYGVEPSVLSNKANGGRTADEVSQEDAPWYPKVWPSVDDTELREMEILAQERFPNAMAKADDRRRIIRPRKSRQH